MSKQAKVDVIVNSEQAKARLKELQDHLDIIKQKRIKAMEEGNAAAVKLYNAELTKTGNEIDKVEKQWTDVDGVLKNMSGSTIRELKTAHTQMRKELESMSRTDPEYASKAAQVKLLKNEIDVASGSMGKQGFTLKGLMSTVGGWAAGLGIATGAMGAVKAVIGATDTLSDKFNETIGGLTAGLSYLTRSIATLDFSNFLTNMGNAITAGREYVSTLDKIGDRTRAIGIIESNDRARLAELLIIRKDVTKTDKERIAAGKEILEIEQKNADRRKSLTKDQLDNELKYAAKMTGLSKERIGQLLIEQETNRAAIEKANKYNEVLANSKPVILPGFENQPSQVIVDDKAIELVKNATPEVKKLAGEISKLGKLNEEEYERITNAYKNVGEANAYYSETTAKTQVGMAKLMKGQLDENESEVKKYTANVAKEVEKEIGSYAKLNTEIGDLEEQFRNLKASDQPIPNDLIHQIISKKGELKEIEESVKAIGEGIALMSMKQAGVIKPSLPTQPGAILKKRNNDIRTGAPEGTEKGLDLGFNKMDSVEKKDYALEQASVIQNAIFDIVKNNQQAALDHKLSILEKEKAVELDNKNLTEQQKIDIEEKYAVKARKIKQDAFKKQKAADIIQGIMSTALAVVKALPNIPLAIAAGIAGAASVAVIAAQPMPEFYEGGFTIQDKNDKKPVGIVHANEFIGSAAAVRNPSIKRYFDVIDYAQKNGTISNINLPAINTLDKKGFRSGGYATNTVIDPTPTSQPVPTASNQLSNEALSITREIAKQIALEFKDGIRGKWS